MTHWDDPILEGWRAIHEEEQRLCLTRQEAMQVAIVGPDALSPAKAEHVLHHRCADDEVLLAWAWGLCPPQAPLLYEARKWPADGAVGAALRTHVASCTHVPCTLFAREVLTAEGPPAIQRKTARVWAGEQLARWGATLAPRGFQMPASAGGPINSPEGPEDAGAPSPAPAELGFGAGLQLVAGPRPDTAQITLDPAQFRRSPQQGLVVIVFLKGADETQAAVVFAADAASFSAVIALPADVLRSTDLRVAVGVTDG
jgi:hypothetical protein